MSLSQNELVWVGVRVSESVFEVNLREDNKVSESKMAVFDSTMAAFKMAAIIKLSQNKWVKFFLCKWWELILASVSEFERKNYYGWIQDGGIQVGRIQDDCHHQVESEWMSEFFLCKMDESKMAEFNMAAIITLIQNQWVKFLLHKMAESKMAAIIKMSQNEWLWVRLN